MQRSIVFLLFSVLLVDAQQQQQQSNYVTVSCSQGPVQGRTVNLGNDQSQLYSGQANAFTGIPYCQAPVGNLRLQPPQPLNTFNTTLLDATSYRPKCPQLNAGAPTNEDCLYLNIYTPQAGNTGANLSVLVLIDGSNGFSNGGCDQNQEKGIVSNLVQRQIVVVTLQYRIGALGFFTTYTNTVQSNLGMLDQVQAMRWIKTEIVNFGGNPNQITVAGQDDGACAVSAHTLSPMSQSLFNQAIVQSGSIYSCYNPTPAVPTNPTVQTTTPRPMYDQPNTGYGNAGFQNGYGYQPPSTTPTSSYNSANAQYDDPNQQLAATLCNISPSQWNDGQTQNIQNCLNNYTVDFFVNQQPGGPTATWMIVRDTSFLPGSIDSLNGNRPNIPIIIGTVQDEDADYAFKLINTGKGNDPNNLDNWIFDFAKKNKLNQTQTNQVSNIIANNYPVNVQRDQPQQQQQQTNNQVQYGGQQTNNQFQSNQGQQVNNQYQNSQGQQTNNQYQGQQNQQNQNQQQFFGGVVAGQQTTYGNINSNTNSNQYSNSQGSSQNMQTNNQYQNQMTYGGQQYSQGTYSANGQQHNQNQGSSQVSNQYQNQNQNFQGTQNQQYNQGSSQTSNQYQNQNQYQGSSSSSSQQTNQYQNNGMYTNVTQYSNTNNYNNGYQRDQSQVQTLPNDISDFSQLRTISQIASDQSTSLTTTQIQSYMQNGDRHVRIYQFTHVSDVGRNTVPNTGANWKPVFKGQDMYFITMSETIWTNSNYTSQDRQVADQMGQRWSDFVKTGQVANWDTTSQQNYNYCNLNTQATQQANYAPQARQVFQDQVNPICQVAQNNYAMANNQSVPYPAAIASRPNTNTIQRTPGTGQVQYTNTANGASNFHITFQVNSLPFNG